MADLLVRNTEMPKRTPIQAIIYPGGKTLLYTYELHQKKAGETEAIELPAADVAPVVRCKDCKHRDPEDHKCDSGQLERAGCIFPVDDDYFCAYGARMEGET